MEDTKPILDNAVRILDVKAKEESINDSCDVVVRLTPTGKISHAKTRVYTQRYRKEWEHMTDFKDWLTSVPFQATRAFCKFCQRDLHAHRLSLLKHMCTLKHQRAAVQFNKRHAADQGNSSDINYIVESLEADDDDDEDDNDDDNEDNHEDGEDDGDNDINYAQEDVEEVSMEGEVEEEIVEELESVEVPPVYKKMRIEKEENQDTLAQAMSHVHSDYLTENDDPIQLEMVVESDHDHDNDNDDDSKSYQYIKYGNSSNSKNQSDLQREVPKKNSKVNPNDIIQKAFNNSESFKTLTAAEAKNATPTTDDSKKVYFFSTGGKTYSLVKSKLPQLVMNQLNDKNFTVVAKIGKSDGKNNKETSSESTSTINTSNVITTITASTSLESAVKNHTTITPSMITKSVLLKKPIVSTHVLETSKGVPACGLQVSLYKLHDGRWTFMHESVTTANGTCNDFSSGSKNNLTTGRYKLHYDVEKYYNMRKTATIYPFIEIVFDIKDPHATYHTPLLVSPFSYSTYKDTHR